MAVEALEILQIRKAYSGVQALRDANLSVRPGEVHALMGENGAGKSTLAKIIAGAEAADSGEIRVSGQPVKLSSPLEAQRQGISIIYQELDLFPDLSLAENVAIANREFSESGVVSFERMNSFAHQYLRRVGLEANPARRLSSLNMGEIQLVAIARALSMKSRILIMDEPTSSLFHDSVERLFELIRALKAEGVAIIYVSHKMDEIFRITDRVTIMRDGVTVGTRVTKEAMPAELIGLMVGREWRAGERAAARTAGSILLSVTGLTTGKLKGVSFELRAGEVLGVAGLVGAGRSELGAALAGLDRWQAGSMLLRGKPAASGSVKQARNLGMRLVAEDRKQQGLMMQMSVLENGTIADLPRFARGGLVSFAKEQVAIAPLFRRIGLKAPSMGAPVSALSGGNQQKVLIARALLGEPDLLFLDDPTRGIDVGAKEDVYRLIEELAAAGKGVIFVSSELPELLRCCDRILVLREGSATAVLDAASTTQEEIMGFAMRPAEKTAWQN